MQKIIVKIDREDLSWLEQDIECYMLDSGLPKKFISEFKNKATSLDKIVLSFGDNAVGVCVDLELDGVVVDLTTTDKIKSEIKNIREKIGESKFLGIVSRPRRHEAMVISENEPDFIMFKVWSDGLDKLKELVDWYLEFFLIQLAIIPQDDEVDFISFNSDIVVLDTEKYKILVDKKKRLG